MALTADFVTNQPVPFQRIRQAQQALAASIQEGVAPGGDFKVSERSAGAGGPNMSVDVAAGDAGVDVDSGVRNGRAHVNSTTVYNAVVGASHASMPRVDRVVVQYNDTGIPAGVGGNDPTIRVIPGVPTVGATLDNADTHGAAPVPADALLLGEFVVPAGSTAVVNANIRDRRKWARGAFVRIIRNLDAGGGNDYSTASATLVDVDPTNLSPRVECSGRPVRVALHGQCSFGAGLQGAVALMVDGAYPADGGSIRYIVTPTNSQTAFHVEQVLAVAAGTHKFAPQFANDGTGTPFNLLARPAGGPIESLTFTVEELSRPSTDNT